MRQESVTFLGSVVHLSAEKKTHILHACSAINTDVKQCVAAECEFHCNSLLHQHCFYQAVVAPEFSIRENDNEKHDKDLNSACVTVSLLYSVCIKRRNFESLIRQQY